MPPLYFMRTRQILNVEEWEYLRDYTCDFIFVNEVAEKQKKWGF